MSFPKIVQCKRGHPPEDHDCRKNHEGSSKSMEPASAVNILCHNPNFEKANVKCAVLVGDEDAGVISQVQRNTPHEVQKWLDINHVVKKFSNKLYAMAKTYKFLSSEVIKYLKKCFSYVISQHKNDVEGLKQGLRNILNHTFGRHNICGDWCKARNDSNYNFKHLPHGKPFSCPV